MVVTTTTTVPQKMCGTTQEQSRLSYRALMPQQSDVVDVVDVEAVAKERGLGGVHQQMVQPRLMVGGRNSSVAIGSREKKPREYESSRIVEDCAKYVSWRRYLKLSDVNG
jgi:hypothetical protein